MVSAKVGLEAICVHCLFLRYPAEAISRINNMLNQPTSLKLVLATGDPARTMSLDMLNTMETLQQL